MRARFSDAFTELPMSQRRMGSRLIRDFDIQTGEFRAGNPPKQIYSLELRMDLDGPCPAHYDSRQHRILLSKQDMMNLLDPILDKARGLIDSQQQSVANLCTRRKVTVHWMMIMDLRD